MAKTMALLLDAWQTDARLADGTGEKQRGGGYGKSRGVELEMPGDQLIEYLIVLAAADAVDELVGG